MRSAKNYGLGLLASFCLFSSCMMSRPASYNPRIKQFAHDTEENHCIRAESIAKLEVENPHGFIPANKHFAISDLQFSEERTKTRVGIDIKDSTYYLKTTDYTQPPDAGCNYSATVYLGKYADQSHEMKALLPRAAASIQTSTRKLRDNDDKYTLYKAVDSNNVMVYRKLGGGFMQKSLVDLKQKTIANFSCDHAEKPSAKVYDENPTLVLMTKNYTQSKGFKADGRVHYKRNLSGE